MASGLQARHWVMLAVAATAGALVLGAVGLIVGADYGGNYCCDCEFNGQRGYEATGQVGFLVGAVVGFCSSAWAVYGVMRRRISKS